jgi:hypothetical protein
MKDVPVTSASIGIPVCFFTAAHMLKHAIGIPVTIGVADPYKHEGAIGPLPDAFAYEVQQTSAGGKNQLFWGGRVNSASMTLDLTGGVIITYECEFSEQEPASDTPVADTLITHPDNNDPFDSIETEFLYNGSPFCGTQEWTWTIDHNLQTDNHARGCDEGRRVSLPRDTPVVSGTWTVFKDSDTYAIEAAAEARTPVSFTLNCTETVDNRSVELAFSNVILAVTGKPIDTAQGLQQSFDWRASGTDCVVYTVWNGLDAIP